MRAVGISTFDREAASVEMGGYTAHTAAGAARQAEKDGGGYAWGGNLDGEGGGE